MHAGMIVAWIWNHRLNAMLEPDHDPKQYILSTKAVKTLLVLTDFVEVFSAWCISIHGSSNQQIMKPVVVIDKVMEFSELQPCKRGVSLS
jgi:hypothetical protein